MFILLWKVYVISHQFHCKQPARISVRVLYLCSCVLFYSDLRTLVVDMVLATDMSSHFEQLRAMKAALSVLGR